MRLTPSFCLIVLTFLFTSVNGQKTKQSNWKQEVNYSINVDLDDQNNVLRGFETIEYINNSPSQIDEIYIHLWPNAYKNDQTAFAKQQLLNGETSFYFSSEEERGYIDSLDFFVNGKGVIWNFDSVNNDIAKIILNKPLKSGEKCSISTPFKVKIPIVFSRLGHDKQTYNITQWYPKPAVYDVNGWNPMPYLNQGEFYSEYGSFDVKISLPKNYVIAATGELMTESEEKFRKAKGKTTGPMENTFCFTAIKTVHFKQDNIHDFAWFASKNFGIRKKETEVMGKTIETYIYSVKDSDLKEEYTEAINIALRYYSEHAGLYPYKSATVVKSELKAGGGMEYPMITVCDILSKEVIIHEVGHNWFYGILGSNERRYPWMDESINSFFESESMKDPLKDNTKKEKRQSFFLNINDNIMELMAINSMRNNRSQSAGIHSDEFNAINYGTMVYGKGSIVFKHLQAYLGEKRFTECFKAYYEKWKYKHPLPGDMQETFETVSGEKLDWFFNTLINTDFKIDYKIASVKERKDGNTTVKLSSNVPKNMPVPVALYSHDELLSVKWSKDGELNFEKDTNTLKTTHLMLDPQLVTFDINRKNNQYKVNGIFKKWANPGIRLFSALDNKTARQMYVLPMLGFNIHNGFLLGAGFHNWTFPERAFEYFIAPIWGFKSQTLNGYANFNYRIKPKTSFEKIDIGVNNASFAYEPGAIYGPNTEKHSYFRTNIFSDFTFKPKDIRKNKVTHLKLEFTNVQTTWLRKMSENPDGRFINNTPEKYRFGRITFEQNNKRVINPYNFIVTLESGGYTDSSDFYFKPGIEFNFIKSYKKKKKGLSVRVFAGSFIANNKDKVSGFMYRIGDKNGVLDYGMEQTLVGRGASDGLWSKSISPNGENMKVVGTIGNLSNAFISLNINSTLPGKIPFRPYADLILHGDKTDFTDNNGKAQALLYTAGIELDIIPGSFVVYFPLVQSKLIEERQKTANQIENFGQRICFTLIINDFQPKKLAKRAKLF